MRFSASIFARILEPIPRRMAAQIAARHDADRYDKTFKTWDHFLALSFVQLSGAESLREVETRWNAQSHQHYHLGVGPIKRSTLCDANRRRPPEAFAELFQTLAAKADKRLRREGAEMVRLIDATPIPLDQMCAWAASNGRIRGLKMHVVYDPHADVPQRVEITPANINDVEVGGKTPIEAGAVYVFDKAYYSFDWWAKIHLAKAKFVTRPKANTRFRTLRKRRFAQAAAGDGFTILEDADVTLQGKRSDKLDMVLRLVRIKRDNGMQLVILTNDLKGSARRIALLYKARWQIELLFRWLKQHLKLRRFLGRSENAIRLQIIAAMIVFLLLRMAAAAHRLALPALRFAELVADSLFLRKPIDRIDKPPAVNASKPRPKTVPGQLQLCYG